MPQGMGRDPSHLMCGELICRSVIQRPSVEPFLRAKFAGPAGIGAVWRMLGPKPSPKKPLMLMVVV